MEHRVGGTRIRLVRGDITGLEVDAIVNAANSRLQMGGGVAGAIRRRGGESIQRECDSIGGTPVGTAVITGGGELKAAHVIHAVGPRMGEGDEDRKLSSATTAVLEVAEENSLRSVALPAISTGIFGYPAGRAADRMLSAALDYLEQGEHCLEEVIFCLYDEKTYSLFRERLEELSGG